MTPLKAGRAAGAIADWPAYPISQASSGGIAVDKRFVVESSPEFSEPDKPMRRSERSARREAQDPAYQKRKAEARSALAAELCSGRAPRSLGEVRMACGFSQHDLARITGLTQPHIAKIEARKLTVNLITAMKLAQALNLELDKLAPLILPFNQLSAVSEPGLSASTSLLVETV